MNKVSCALGLLVLASLMSADRAGAADAASATIPQPHLAKARAAAAAGKSWSEPGLINCYSDQNIPVQKILKDPPPAKAFDNLYNVGLGPVTAWAITTRDGIILIDTLDNSQEAKDAIVGGLKKLGLDPADIKIIIVSHGHADHYGGARYLQDTIPGVHLYMSAVDYDLADKAAAGPRANGVAAPRRDRLVKDGDTITLGEETITLYITPGHTPGTLSMIIPVREHGVEHKLSFWGGTASASLTPEMHRAYDQSLARFSRLARAAKVDGYIGNHPSLDDSALKLERMREAPELGNAFLVGTTETLRYYTVIKECNLNNQDLAAATHKPGT